MRNKFCETGLFWWWLAVIVLGADLLVKQWVMTHFLLGESLPLLPFFSFTYAHNPGAAFSFLADSGGWQRWFFAVIAVAVCVALLVMLYQNKRQAWMSNLAYVLILGGALGNLFDRMVHGVVIDFLHFHVGSWSFPIFNLADVAICSGAGLILLETIIISRRGSGKKHDEP